MGCQCKRAGRACQAGQPRRAAAPPRHRRWQVGEGQNPIDRPQRHAGTSKPHLGNRGGLIGSGGGGRDEERRGLC
jgi:hypothetical protein